MSGSPSRPPLRHPRHAIALVCAGVLLAIAPSAIAQLAPVGAHHLGVGPAAAHSPVSPTGAFSTTVPLDLPAGRGGIPLPLAVVYTGNPRVGAAGAGWDIPLSFVRVSRSTMRRKPTPTIGWGPDRAPTRVVMSIGGQMQYMVPTARPQVYRPQTASAYSELQFSSATQQWTYDTADGLRYVFVPASTVDTSHHAQIVDPDWYLLKEIRRLDGRDRVELVYYVRPYCGDVGSPEIDLIGLRYTFRADGTRPLYEVRLAYEPYGTPPPENRCAARLLAHTLDSGYETWRSTVLDRIEVVTDDNHGLVNSKVTRAYAFGYADDADTGSPRLASVDTFGEVGFENSQKSLPVARYQYGSASGAITAPGRVQYDVPIAYRVGTSQHRASAISTSEVTRAGGVETTSLRSLLHDFTGDGLPDYLYRTSESGRTVWHLVRNRPAGESRFQEDATSQGAVITWSEPSELSVQTSGTQPQWRKPNAPPPGSPQRPTPGPPQTPPPSPIPSDTWVQFMDWNADGRPDVIDARESGHWTVYINEGVVGAQLSWRAVHVDISTVRAQLAAHGHAVEGRISIEHSVSFPRVYRPWCGAQWYRFQWEDDPPGTTRETLSSEECRLPWPGDSDVPSMPDEYELERTRNMIAPGDTVKEWGLVDGNGDRYPDLAIGVPYRVEEHEAEAGMCEAPSTTWYERNGPYENWDVRDAIPLGNSFNHGWDLRFQCAGVYRAWLSPVEGEHPSSYLHNIAGTHLTDDAQVFSSTRVTGPDNVETWTNGALPYSPGTTLEEYHNVVAITGGVISDADGDGLADWDSNTRIVADRHAACDGDNAGDTTYTSLQTSGLVDINGDGLPDRVWAGSPTSVQFGTGVGFGPSRRVSSLGISHTSGSCVGPSATDSGLLDIDGDGRPERVWFEQDPRYGGSVMFAASLMVSDEYAEYSSSSGQGAGRLVAIDNGYGAITRIAYRNNKLDTRTRPGVPSPEIVVESTRIEVAREATGTPIEPTYYAYGDARTEYDPIWGSRDFVGYDRTVVLTGKPSRAGTDVQIAGSATITDRRRRSTDPITVPDVLGSFRSRMLRNLPQRTTVLTGTFDPDPRALLTVDVAADYRVTGAQEVEHELLELDGTPSGVEPWIIGSGVMTDCAGGWDSLYCARAAIIYPKRTMAWEGAEAPPSGRNVRTVADVDEVDGFGRATHVIDFGDHYTVADDRCSRTVYAAPPAGFPAFYSLVDSVIVDDCGVSIPPDPDRPPVPPTPIAGTHFTYDALGRMTSSIVDRFDMESRLYLGSFVSQRIPEYDALGSARRIERPRGIGTATTQVTAITYDKYSLTPTETIVSSTDQSTSFRTQSTVNTLRAQRTYWVFPTGSSVISYRDRFGRPTKEIVMPAGGTGNLRKLSETIYDDDTPRQRSVTVVTYPGTAVDNSVVGAEQIERTYLDALGRPHAVQRSLGADYGREWMAQAIRYDSLGRVAYQSIPQRTNAAPYVPADNALPYGTTYFYDTDGDLLGSVTGPGRATHLGYSYPAGDIYVTRSSKYFANGSRYDLAYGPKDLDPMSDTFGDYAETRSTAAGWVVETARRGIDLAAFDRVEHFYNRFGRETRTLRHGDGLATTEWRTRHDSLGNVLERIEPGAAPVTHSYDEWGGLQQSTWTDDDGQHYARWTYDGLARPTEYRLEKQPPRDALEREWTQFYYYDEHSESPHQPQSPSLLGRLSWIHVPSVGSEFYGYDGLQQGTSTTTVHADDGVPYRTSQRLSVGGRLDAVTFDIPGRTESVAYTYDSAEHMRRATLSADGTTTDLFQANQFDDLGRYRALTFGNGVRESFDYAPTGRQLLKGWSVTAPASTYQRLVDGRDADGRITALREVTSTLPGDETAFAYTYDRLGRLLHSRATGRENRDEDFTYDALGNLRTGSDLDVEYAYGNAVDKDRLTAVGRRGAVLQPLQYDGAGNVRTYTPVGKPAVGLTYDTASRVTSLTSANGDQARFTYGPGGSLFREHVVTSTGETDIRHYGGSIERRTRPDGKTHVELRVPGPLGTLVSLRREGTAKNDYRVVTAQAALYPHGDDQGNRLFTDDDGRVVQTAQYRAFGSLTESTGTPGSLLYTDDLWNAGDTYDSFGVTLLGARVYDPVVGRFLQRDPIRAIGSASRANPYAFSWGDPINLADPTGMSPSSAIATLFKFLDPVTSRAGATWIPGVGDIVAANAAYTAARLTYDLHRYSRMRRPRLPSVWDDMADTADTVWGWGIDSIHGVGDGLGFGLSRRPKYGNTKLFGAGQLVGGIAGFVADGAGMIVGGLAEFGGGATTLASGGTLSVPGTLAMAAGGAAASLGYHGATEIHPQSLAKGWDNLFGNNAMMSESLGGSGPKIPAAKVKSSSFGPKIADVVPSGVPKNWSVDQIADAMADYTTSIASRKAELAAFDAAGIGSPTQRLAHARRISQEEAFLRKLTKALGPGE